MAFLLFAVISLIASFVYWLFKRQDYFKNNNIPYIKSFPILGTFFGPIIGTVSFYERVLQLYNDPAVKDKPFFGITVFHKHGLMITEPDLIKKIFVKDFNHFANRYSSSDVHDPIGYYNLFTVKNPLWRSLRAKLSPFFTSGKMKTMYHLVDEISENMMTLVKKRLGENVQVEMDLKDLTGMYTTDAIASCAFGIEANSLENPDGEFRKQGYGIFARSQWRNTEFTSFLILPQIMKFFGFYMYTESASKFIHSTVVHVMAEREKSGNKRNDLIDALIEIKKSDIKDNDGLALSMEMLSAQAGIFFAAGKESLKFSKVCFDFYFLGFETSSMTQSYALFHISKNEEIQDRVRGEVRDMLVRTEGKVTYDSMMNTTEMPYLHQIVMETLRIYPTIVLLDRECISKEGYSLEPFSDFRVPYGMPLYIPMYANYFHYYFLLL